VKSDILNREDIHHLVDVFHEKVKKDSSLKPYFNSLTELNWNKHLDNMCEFWDNILFHSGHYEGNPMSTHKKIHQSKRITTDHFKQWIFLFEQTVDELFKGKNATNIKKRAFSIATIMQTTLLK
jgi:hemoglobin